MSRHEVTRQHSNRLRLITYNIISAGGSRIIMALRAMNHMHIDLGILTETKLTNSMYTQQCYGYEVIATKSTSLSQGGVALFYRQQSSAWSIEGLKCHGPNVISCTLIAGKTLWGVIGAYIPPSESSGETLQFIDAAIMAHRNHPIIFLGDINVDLHRLKNHRSEDIATALEQHGLQDVGNFFLHPRGRWTFSQFRENRRIQSVTDCILSDYPEIFRRWTIKIPRFDTDHRAILVEIELTLTSHHRHYIQSRTNCPVLNLPRPLNQMDQLFNDLLSFKQSPSPKSQRDRSWIAADTWRLIDQRNDINRRLNFPSLFSSGTKRPWREILSTDELQAERHRLHREIRRLLRRDRRARINKVSQQIQECLVAKNITGAYDIFRGWYRDFVGIHTKPTHQELEHIKQEFSSLLAYAPPSGLPLPINVTPFAVNDEIPNEEEIYTAIKHLRLRRAPGPSRICTEDLRFWHDNNPLAWSKLITLIQLIFREGQYATDMTRGILCLLPKPDGTFRGISLLDVVYKICSVIIHTRLSNAIEFHDGIHGFRRHRGTCTAILEAKLQMQLAANSSCPLFQVFIDLKKAYDSVDRERVLHILCGYGVGPRLCTLIQQFWNQFILIPKSVGYYGTPFHPERGIPQGDITSPIIFNILVDCVLREWYRLLEDPTILSVYFYADDGRLSGYSPTAIQFGLDLFQDLFSRIGLHFNAKKTKTMISINPSPYRWLSTEAFKRRYDHTLPTFKQRKVMRITCQLCNHSMQTGYLEQHMLSQHGILQPPLPDDSPLTDSITYTINYGHQHSTPMPCPVDGCIAIPRDWTHMRQHFAFRHPNAIIISEDQGILPQCSACGRFLHSVNDAHLASRACRSMAARRAAFAQIDNNKKVIRSTFYVNSSPIENVSKFLYLGRYLSADDSDDVAIWQDIVKARYRWHRCGRVLSSLGATPRIMARFYLAIVQAILLYGSETWNISQRSLRRLETFHHRCARYIAHRHIHRLVDGTWIYPSSIEILDICNLSPISTYIALRKQRLLHSYAENSSPFYRDCNALALHNISSNHHLKWW
jgi:exonuclease III